MKNEGSYFSPRGETWNLFLLFFPLVGTAFSNYLFIFLEKLFLSRISQQALEAAINVTYVCQMFQMATVALAMMAQVFVGRWFGARKYASIGPGIWQFIWFSILSTLITVPGCILYGMWYFHGTEIEETARTYFYILTGTNFLYPLAATLSAYFLGQGKTKLILFANISEQFAKIILAFVLVFGVGTWIPGFGILGGVISSVIIHTIFCIALGIFFLNKKENQMFQTHNWKLQPTLFWECIQPGLFRAFNRISSVIGWGVIAHLMVAKGGDHLLILSLGGSLSIFLPFVFEAIYQAQTIVLSQHIGAKRYTQVSNTVRSGVILVSLSVLLTSIPFLSCSATTFDWFYPGIFLDPLSIQLLFFGVWIWFVYFTFSAIPISYILAFKDTKFYFILGSLTCVTDYFFMYVLVEKIAIPANWFWIALGLVQAISTIPIYFWRMMVLRKNALENRLRVS